MDTTLLTVFLLVNAFVIGVLVVLGAQYLLAHKRGKAAPAPASRQEVSLPPEIRERLLQAAELDFQNVLAKTGDELQREQTMLADQLNTRLDELGTAIVDDEMKRYRAKLDELRLRAERNLAGAHAETEAHQNEIDATLEKTRSEIEAQLRKDAEGDREKLRAQLDLKLSDAVVAFLMETLTHNIDIGAQHNYLLSQLEEHKQELIDGVVTEEATRKQQ